MIEKMDGLGVVVECFQFPKGDGVAKDKLSCSGIYVGNGWFLTHGTIAIDLLKEEVAEPVVKELKECGFSFNGNDSSLKKALDKVNFKFQAIFGDNGPVNDCESKLLHGQEVSKSLGLKDLSHPSRLQDRTLQLPPVSSSVTNPKYINRHVDISLLFVQPGVAKTLATLMPASDGWKLMDKEDHHDSLDLETIILSSFVLLKIINVKDDSSHTAISSDSLNDMMSRLMTRTTNVNKGTNVYIESTPFGSLSPGVFFNSLSKGIISNICGTDQDLCLTDARCIMGSEGAPVYTLVDEIVNLCGIVISPFCWKHGEWLGLSVLAAARPVLQTLCQCMKFTLTVEDPQRPISKLDVARTLDNAVVGITCGGGWGSGIVINTSPGLVLTCAHVIQPVRLGEVTVITADGTRIPGRVIYHTFPKCFLEEDVDDLNKQGCSMWDLAVVETSVCLSKALPLASRLPPKGSPLYVAGHGIFSPKYFPAPMVSHGILSKTVSVAADSLRYGIANQVKSWDCKSQVKRHNIISSLSCSQGNSDTKYEVKPSVEEVALMLGDSDNGLVPVMFQTTCLVYAGNSGGPVVAYHPEEGFQILGIMVCNTKDLTNKATFPHVNLAIPAPAIHKVLSTYISSKDKSVLDYLGVECLAVSRLWALEITPQSQL